MVRLFWGAFHLVKNSENSSSGLNEKRFFGSPDWKIPRKSRTAKKVVPFSRWKLPNGKSVFHLQISRLYCFYQQFQTFRGLLTSQASSNGTCRKWNALFQTEIPKRNFPKVFVNGKRPWTCHPEEKLFS